MWESGSSCYARQENKETRGQHLPSSRQLGGLVAVVVLEVADSWGISSAVLVATDFHTNIQKEGFYCRFYFHKQVQE